MDAYSIARDIYLQRYLNEPGPDLDIDLRRYREGSQLVGDPLAIGLRDGRWFAAHWNLIPYDEWTNKALQLVAHDPDVGTIRDVWNLGAALEPRWSRMRVDSSQILHVAFDMRRPIQPQIADAQRKLSSIRDYLYRFTKTGKPRDKSENTWRDVYIFMLAKGKRVKVKEIAAEFFPRHDHASRELNVYRIIRRVAQAAARVGVVLPRCRS